MGININDPNVKWDDLLAQAKSDWNNAYQNDTLGDYYSGGQTMIGDLPAQIYLNNSDGGAAERNETVDPWNGAVFNYKDPNGPYGQMTQLYRADDGSIGKRNYAEDNGIPWGALAVIAAPFAVAGLQGALGAAAGGAAEAVPAVASAAPVAAEAAPGALGSGMFGAVGPSVDTFGLGAGVGDIATGGVMAGLEGAPAIGAITPSLSGASASSLLDAAYPGAEGFTIGGASVGPEVIGDLYTGGAWGGTQSLWDQMADRLKKDLIKKGLNQLISKGTPGPAVRPGITGGATGAPGATSTYIKPPYMGALQQVQATQIPIMRSPYGNTNLVAPTMPNWEDIQ